MKTPKSVYLLPLFLFITILLGAQTECKVLLEDNSGQYIGKCKKGLAHGNGQATGLDSYSGRFKNGLPSGKGIYTWANGDVYDGEWEKGQRDGFGIYSFQYKGKDSLLVGMWEYNEYKGPRPIMPKVGTVSNVDRYSFRRLGDGDRFSVNIYQNGTRNISIVDLHLVSTSGSNFESGSIVGYDYVNFPVTCNITYVTWNKAHTAQVLVRFEFEISQAGNWEVNIHN